MAVTVTRTKTDLIGTPASPASISAAATVSPGSGVVALDHTSPAGVIEASIALRLIAGASAPTTAVTIRFQFSEDGTNYVQYGPDVSLTMANSTSYDYEFDPPPSSQKSAVTIINGATNAITAWCQGGTLAVS